MSNRRFKGIDNYQFVVVGPILENLFKGGSYKLTDGYIDNHGDVAKLINKKAGSFVQFIGSRDAVTGRDKPKPFRFDESLRRIMVRKTDQDINGLSQYVYLKNHPECEGSPNGFYEEGDNGERIQTGITFRELNSAKDALVALTADKARNKAETVALSLDAQALTEIANILGYYGEPDFSLKDDPYAEMRLKVAEYARKRTPEFNELLNSDDRGIRALLRKGLAEFVLTEKNRIIKWEGTTIGTDEDDAIRTLRRDKSMLKALQEALDFFIVEVKSTRPSKEKPTDPVEPIETESTPRVPTL